MHKHHIIFGKQDHSEHIDFVPNLRERQDNMDKKQMANFFAAIIIMIVIILPIAAVTLGLSIKVFQWLT